jgi:hypothetical protein
MNLQPGAPLIAHFAMSGVPEGGPEHEGDASGEEDLRHVD